MTVSASESLVRVFRWLGNEQGIRFHELPMRDPIHHDLREATLAIAQRSGVRFRSIRLGAQWWREDCGLLLGYRVVRSTEANTLQPIGLSPRPSGGYDAFDPELETLTPLSDAEAAQVADRAVQFFRPLPEHALRLRDLPGRVLKPFRREFGQLLAAMALLIIPAALLPLLTQVILDGAVPDANHRLLIELGCGLIAIMAGQAIGTVTQGFLLLRIRAAGTLNVQAAIWDRLLRLPLTFFRRYPSGELLNRAMLIETFAQSISGSLYRGIFGGITGLVYLTVLFTISGRLAMLAVGLAILSVGITIGIGQATIRATLRAGRADGRVYGWLVQLLRGLFVLRSSGAESRAHERWANRFGESLLLTVHLRRLGDWNQLLGIALPTFGSILLYLQVIAIRQDAATTVSPGMTTGEFLAFVTAFGLVLSGVQSFSRGLLDILDGTARLKLVQPILDEPATPPGTAPEMVLSRLADPGELVGAITAEGLTFRYTPGGTAVLSDVNVNVPAGAFIAIVGPSGCGKSTLVRLLLGLEAPESGQVRFDGKPLTELHPTRVRRQCGVVLQSTYVLQGTIFENVAAGRSLSEADLTVALQDAGLAEDIRAMPMNVHTIVNDGGRNLSGGQRQRLLIARALAGNPRVIVFDEATSALDTRTQAQVVQALANRQVTRIIVAHRLNTIVQADQIIVMDAGRIVQVGEYSELAAQPGLFRDLLARQQLEGETS